MAITPRLGPVELFDAGIGTDGKIRVYTWDRFTSWGPKTKSGSESEFNEETLGQMVDNWRARGGRLAMCQDHKSVATPYVSAPGMAFYDALAIVRNGEVLRFEKLVDSAATPPEPATLKAQVAKFGSAQNPDPEPDGLWGFRCEVTPLGEDPREGMRNYRGISPLFTANGTDERGNDIGYVLYDVAATNTAFQSGCEITFQRLARKTMKMTEEMARKLGLAEGYSDDDAKAALQRRYEEMKVKFADAADEELQRMADEAGEYAKCYDDQDGDELSSSMRKLAHKMRRFTGTPEKEPDGDEADDDGGEGDREEKAAMEAMAQRLGLPSDARPRQIFAAMQAGTVPVSELAALRARIDAQERAGRERDAKEKEANVVRFVDEAVGLGRYPTEKRDDLLALARENLKSAERVLLKPGTFASKEVAMGRLTNAGSPLGVDPRSEPITLDRRVVQNEVATFEVFGESFSAMAREMADSTDSKVKAKVDAVLSEDERAHPGVRLIAANRILKQERPDLWTAAQEQ
jgi:hypothetical protein